MKTLTLRMRRAQAQGCQGHGWVQKQEEIPDQETMPCFCGLVGSHPGDARVGILSELLARKPVSPDGKGHDLQ